MVFTACQRNCSNRCVAAVSNLISFLAADRLCAGAVGRRGGNIVALKMTNREVDGVAVVALDGRIVLGEESNALREKIKSLIAEGKKKIVLNMDNITFIDSAGLGTLVAAHHSAKSQGAGLRLCHLGSKFQEVLQITKLLTVFEVYNTEAEAVGSFAKE
jgi:anti-sigma B factor antagonist